jgi:hypothetical protein
MSDDEQVEELLLIVDYEDEEEGIKHLVCFLNPEDAQERNPFDDTRMIVGEFEPGPDGEFHPSTLQVNPEFLHALVHFMNECAIEAPDLLEQARQHKGGHLYLVDPRYTFDGGEPPISEILGGFAIDESGKPVPSSFRINPEHLLFKDDTGVSGILFDRVFYDWLHGSAEEAAGDDE